LNGKESLAGKWVLHKLNTAIKATNLHLELMNFMEATKAVYQFWLYELCDVYLEVCKPVFDGDDVEAKAAAQDVLYICLDQGLKLLHPFMPFVTEELYQRLPRRPEDKIETIMLAKFPQSRVEWDSSQSEADFEYVNAIVRASRSLLNDYNIKKEGKIYISTSDKTKQELVRLQAQVCQNLVRGCESLKYTEEVPEGCALSTAVPETSVYLLVKGQVDISVELEKFKAKLGKIQSLADSLKAKMEVPGYKQVKEEVVASDTEKLNAYQSEITALQTSVAQFEKFL
jgi:valyl-tRNA synthetase